MHRERLHSLSDEELLKMAEENDILSIGSFDRTFLIEEIYSSLSDSHYEQNLSVRLLSKRYEFVENTTPLPNEKILFDLTSEHENHLYTAVHSPQWLFVDWHTGKNIEQSIRSNTHFLALYLRLYVLKEGQFGYALEESHDIEVEQFSGRQYCVLPSTQAYYKVILVADLGDRERIVCESRVSFLVGSPSLEHTRKAL
jgi:hypothetical protein